MTADGAVDLALAPSPAKPGATCWQWVVAVGPTELDVKGIRRGLAPGSAVHAVRVRVLRGYSEILDINRKPFALLTPDAMRAHGALLDLARTLHRPQTAPEAL